MTTKGIIFSAPMVRALLDGRKTQTRRLIKPQPVTFEINNAGEHCEVGLIHVEGEPKPCIFTGRVLTAQTSPYAPGDRLYVRESILQSLSGFTLPCGEWESYWTREKVEYAADGAKERFLHPERYGSPYLKKRPSIHMPRWASRLWLEVTDVRVQRVQEISGEDAVAEGVRARLPDNGIAQQEFQDLWNSLHTKPGETWADNPWIVAVSFDVHHGNIDGVQP